MQGRFVLAFVLAAAAFACAGCASTGATPADAARPLTDSEGPTDAAPGIDGNILANGYDAEAGGCTVDSSEIACCCRGDVGGNGPFCSGGSLSCETGFGLYFGADCTRECGPCTIPCPDSGTSGAGVDAADTGTRDAADASASHAADAAGE